MQDQWEAGERVLAWRGSGQCLWYPAAVRAVEGGHYTVEFADGQVASVPPDQLRPLEVGKGSRVQCLWQAGAQYYSGAVANLDGPKLHIAYDDGDEEWVEVGLLRLGGSVPPSARAGLLWTNPDAEKDKPSLVRLTPEGLTLATIPKEDLSRAAARVGDGAVVAGQVIPASAITRVEGEADGSALTVTYRTGPSKTESTIITLADSAAREGLLGALLEQLGPAWQRRRTTTSRWVAGTWVLGGTVVVALLTWMFYSEAAQIAAGRNPKVKGRSGMEKLGHAVLQWVEGLIGPFGVLILGAVLTALGVLVFFGVMVAPPAQTVLEPVRETGKAA